MKNLEKFEVRELSSQEGMELNGGISILNIYGLFDGIKGNSQGYLFGFCIWGC